ncbi:hypothetical protein C8J57DRAFT_1227840 [Mycena rebaudengoi]|nr:hypothetical protein C8J57DRAFT_1227840 [Mycena rebaudengoi]
MGRRVLSAGRDGEKALVTVGGCRGGKWRGAKQEFLIMSVELARGIVLDDEAEDREEDDPLESEGVRPEELEDAGLGLLVDGGMRRSGKWVEIGEGRKGTYSSWCGTTWWEEERREMPLRLRETLLSRGD